MNKIFRLHTNGSETVEDWQETAPMQDVHIATIPDPAGAQVSHEITSIPTPFARIDVAKNAYRQLNATGQLDGTTIYHKIVSDCLDVLEIFFQAPLLGNTVEIIPWNSGVRLQGSEITIDPASDLGELLGTQSGPAQRLFGQTLKMFLQQDAASYNFTQLRQLYLLNYTAGPNPLNIIGGTSPATITFSSGNDLSFVNINLGDRKAFAGPPRALHRRTGDFIRYVFALRESIPQFGERFSDFNGYLLDGIFPKLPEAAQAQIRALNPLYYDSTYTDITIATTGAGDHPEILGHPLKGIAGVDEQVAASDFRLLPGAGKMASGTLPLVLPTYSYPRPLQYVGSPWSADTRVPYADAAPIESRRLPGMAQVSYPYLTVSDLLEDYLIRLPFAMDGERFFTGHLESETGYALPLKPAVFRYFSVADLQGVLPGTGLKMFELKKGVAGSIDAVLRLPIQKGNFIELKRTYKTSQSVELPQRPAPDENKGVISDAAFTLALYPFLKTGTDENAHYRVLLADADKEAHTRHLNYRLAFFKDDASGTERPVAAVQRKEDKSEEYFTTDIYALDGEFDFIQVISNLPLAGLLIPKFRNPPDGQAQFVFSVDFGTTNTHIEYSVNGGPAQPFTMGGKESQVGLLHLDTDANYNQLSQMRRGLGVLLKAHHADLLPETIGDGNYAFPQRTVLYESKRLGRMAVGKALAGNNIAFTYERGDTSNYQDAITNLKWAGNDPGGKSRNRISTFIEELVMLIRNKILMNGGRVETAKIVWFYPSSMTSYERGRLEEIWDMAVRTYLSPQARIERLSESVAPFYYYKHSGGMIVGNSHSVNIDIGGGTTDLVLFKGESPVDSTSFRFAGNAIFGDGYGSNADNNGFIRAFEDGQLRRIMDDPNISLGQFREVYRSLKARQDSDDVISFLFTLHRHPEYRQYGIDFTRYLQEHTQLKMVPLLAFAAMIYHTARWMEAGQYPYPQNITFSGSGSKFLDLLDTSRNPPLKNLALFTNAIFTSVYEQPVNDIRLKRVDNPKEVTAKGGLNLTSRELTEDVKRSVLPAVKDQEGQSLTYADLDRPEVQDGAVAEVTRFLDWFRDWNQQLNLKSLFDVDMQSYTRYDAILRRDLRISLEEGINKKRGDQTTESVEPLQETLFFYPLIPLLNQLAAQIAQTPA
ncbi:MAG: hypothetical protein EOP52_04400 [Sphingobacteriales bacterium]|nr:MAG: hypothetical protein EOP52_04400 [Sphingobacteriales bacterium]